jgi:hypothetical protein
MEVSDNTGVFGHYRLMVLFERYSDTAIHFLQIILLTEVFPRLDADWV